MQPSFNSGSETGGRPREWTDSLIEEMADKFDTWMARPDSIWYEDFCLEEGIDADLLSKWAKLNTRFCGVYKKSKMWQKSKLVKGGLLNLYNSSFTKFVMSNTCGWTEKSEARLSGDAQNPLAFLMQKVDGSTKDLVSETEN